MSCTECAHAEYHGYPPEGAPDWVAFTVYMRCARNKTFTSPEKSCDGFASGEPRIVRDDVDNGL